jgi:predicted NUDIX family NTP pyrophosphohydrolase
MVISAGILVHRTASGGPEVLLAHPGGPIWRNRDVGAWSIPKGLVEAGEQPLAAAVREFLEETGIPIFGDFRPLTTIRQKGGKRVMCWAIEANLDISRFAPGEFQMEWPPRSGRLASFPEIDRLKYFGLDDALVRILPAQLPLIAEALQISIRVEH